MADTANEYFSMPMTFTGLEIVGQTNVPVEQHAGINRELREFVAATHIAPVQGLGTDTFTGNTSDNNAQAVTPSTQFVQADVAVPRDGMTHVVQPVAAEQKEETVSQTRSENVASVQSPEKTANAATANMDQQIAQFEQAQSRGYDLPTPDVLAKALAAVTTESAIPDRHVQPDHNSIQLTASIPGGTGGPSKDGLPG